MGTEASSDPIPILGASTTHETHLLRPVLHRLLELLRRWVMRHRDGRAAVAHDPGQRRLGGLALELGVAAVARLCGVWLEGGSGGTVCLMVLVLGGGRAVDRSID